MAQLKPLLEDLVTANRILASEGVVDAFGHVSVRHPENPGRFFMSWAKSAELVELPDILEFTLDGTPVQEGGKKPYLERFIHGALYEARPDLQAVVHNHSRSVIPFGITAEKLRPVVHSSATIGHEVPVWDSQTNFGDTDLLISNMAMARDFAGVLGQGWCALMRGHGCTVAGKSLREVVYTSVYLEVNAHLQLNASRLGTVKFLSPGEVDKIAGRLRNAKPEEGFDRAWKYWRRHAGIQSGSSS